MRFRNSIRLLMENFKQAFRLFICRAVIAVAAIALCAAFVLPELIEIGKSSQFQTLYEDVKAVFKAFTSLNGTELDQAKSALFGKGGSLHKFLNLLSSKMVEITLVAVGCILVYLLKRFAETVCYFSVGSILNDKMTTYAETNFSTAFVANLGKASAYAAFYVPAVFFFDVVTLAICYVFLAFLPFLFGIFLSVTMVVFCQSLKLTLTGSWMPAMTADGKRARDAIFKKSNRGKKQTLKAFANYVVTVYALIIVNVVSAICTFGSALLITVPASFFLLICTQYVQYYTENGKKYFITYERIATNPDHGDRERFFEYMAQEEKKDDSQKES